MHDLDKFEERAAIMEYDGKLTRFQAETLAAKEQGANRWELIGDVAKRVVEQARDRGSAMAERAGPDGLSGVQRGPEEKARPLPERDRG